MPQDEVCATSLAVSALQAARLAMCATNNTLTTDRPDLPRSEESSWTICFDKEISQIDQAIKALSSTDSGLECG